MAKFSTAKMAATAMVALLSLSVGCSDNTAPFAGDSMYEVERSMHNHHHGKDGDATQGSNDTYSCFDSLKKYESGNYQITAQYNDNAATKRLAFTIHGGAIEPGTTELAEAIANDSTGADYHYYSFTGTRQSNNWMLHVTSTNFDEPQALSIVGSATRSVAVHGCSGDSAIVYIGGRDTTLRNAIKAELDKIAPNQFAVSVEAPGGLGGWATTNICNKNAQSRGVQLELTSKLRTKLMTTLNSGRASRLSTRTPLFWSFIRSVRTAMN